MKEKLISVLEKLEYPVFLQGSLAQDEPYPDSFFTFSNTETPDSSFYDNIPHETIWKFDVNFYSSDPFLVNTKLLEAITLLKQHGFIVDGKGYDIASDERTHTGRGIETLIIER